jgi:hypothetical protein
MLHGKELHPDVMVAKLKSDAEADVKDENGLEVENEEDDDGDGEDSGSSSSSSSDPDEEGYHDRKHNEEARRLYKLAAVRGGEKAIVHANEIGKYIQRD